MDADSCGINYDYSRYFDNYKKHKKMEIIESVIGALFLVFTWWLAEKNRADKKNGKINWKAWASKNWDDALYAVICGIIVGIYREEIVYLLIRVRDLDPDDTWAFYYDLEALILFGTGFFGTSVIKLLIAIGQKLTK